MPPNRPVVSIADLVAKKQEQSPEDHNLVVQEMQATQQLQRLESIESTLVAAINHLVKFLDGRTTKTEVLNQLKDIGTPDFIHIVEAVQQLDKSTQGNKLDIKPLSDGLKTLETQLKLIPKSQPDFKSLEVSNLSEVSKAFDKAINNLKLESPKVNINVEKPNLLPIQTIFKDLLVAVRAIKLPEPQPTDVSGVEKRLDTLSEYSATNEKAQKESNKHLKYLANRPMGGGGSGSKGVFSDTSGNLVYPQLDSSGNMKTVSSGTPSLPAGASTTAKQDTGNTSLASIDTKFPVQGQALAAASIPVVLPNAQITSLTPPANTGYALDASLTTIDTDIKSNVTLHAGTNLIGKVGIDQTTPGTTNAVQANAGTNLNTSSLALDATLTGGTQKSKLVDSGGTNVASVSAAGALKVDASGVAVPITDNSGSLTVDAPVGTPAFVRLSDGAAAISTLPVSLATNTPTLQSGSITAATQATAANLNATVVGTGTFAVQAAATLAAETTKVIGVVRTSDGAGNLLTSNSTTPTAKFALDSNLTSILGTAPTTVGKLDVKGADGDVFVRQATAANLNMTATPIALTKGTQGSTGFSVQDLRDAGRNTRIFMLDAITVAPVAEALATVVQWYGNAAVAGTTTPAVVPAGKTLRLTGYKIMYQSLATVGYAVVRIRANTAGVAVLASPLVASFESGTNSGATTAAVTGAVTVETGSFPEGLELPAATGIGFSVAGYGPTGTLTLEGGVRFEVHGYEY